MRTPVSKKKLRDACNDAELVTLLRLQLCEVVRTLNELEKRELHSTVILAKADAESWHQQATVSKTVYL